MENDLLQLKLRFQDCQKVICAIGDETRQAIIIALLEGGWDGMRVGEITGRTRLSRPAVSHHLKILLDAGILGVRRQGTMNFYYLNPRERDLKKLSALLDEITALLSQHEKQKIAE